jgi:DnaK suppressor protein
MVTKKKVVKKTQKPISKPKAVVKSSVKKKATTSGTAAKKLTVKKAPVKKPTPKKASVKKATPAKKTPAAQKKPVATKAVKKVTKKIVSKVVKKAAPAKKSLVKKSSAAKKPVIKTPAKKIVAKKATPALAVKAPAKKVAPKVAKPVAVAVAPKSAAPKVAKPVAPEVAIQKKPAPVVAAPNKSAKPVGPNNIAIAKSHGEKKTVAEKIEEKKHSPIHLDGKKMGLGITGPVSHIPPYRPTPGEIYMDGAQLKHFVHVLTEWKKELLSEASGTVSHMQMDNENFPDLADKATQEEEFNLELKARDRERKLIKKIEESLQKIEAGDFGYCEICGTEIGLARLEVRPTANLCIDCKRIEEMREKQNTF